jgi:hypothetical protein
MAQLCQMVAARASSRWAMQVETPSVVRPPWRFQVELALEGEDQPRPQRAPAGGMGQQAAGHLGSSMPAWPSTRPPASRPGR